MCIYCATISGNLYLSTYQLISLILWGRGLPTLNYCTVKNLVDPQVQVPQVVVVNIQGYCGFLADRKGTIHPSHTMHPLHPMQAMQGLMKHLGIALQWVEAKRTDPAHLILVKNWIIIAAKKRNNSLTKNYNNFLL